MASEEQIRIRDIVVAPPEAFGRKFARGAPPGQTYRGEIIAAVEAGTWLVHWEDDGAYLATEEKYLTLCVRPAPLVESTPDATDEEEDSPLVDRGDEPAAPDATPPTRATRPLEDTSGGANPRPRRRRRVQEPVNYYPVTCAAGTVVGVGLGYLGVG